MGENWSLQVRYVPYLCTALLLFFDSDEDIEVIDGCVRLRVAKEVAIVKDSGDIALRLLEIAERCHRCFLSSSRIEWTQAQFTIGLLEIAPFVFDIHWLNKIIIAVINTVNLDGLGWMAEKLVGLDYLSFLDHRSKVLPPIDFASKHDIQNFVFDYTCLFLCLC